VGSLKQGRDMRNKVSVVLGMVLDAPDFNILEQPTLVQAQSYRSKVRSNGRNYVAYVDFIDLKNGSVKLQSKRLIHTFNFNLDEEHKISYLSSRDYHDEITDYMIEFTKRRGD
jgi:hypothetical protein